MSSIVQALYKYLIQIQIFNSHNNPHIVPILLIHEEKFVTGPVRGRWEPTLASEPTAATLPLALFLGRQILATVAWKSTRAF